MDDSADLRAILAANLRRMIERHASAGTKPSVRAWANSKEVSVRLIDRLVKGQHAITLDKLQELADALGLKPWHLLLPDLDADNPPKDALSPEDAALLKRIRRMLDK